MKRIAVPILSGLLAGSMLYFPSEAALAAADAMRLWALAVLPSLFPFLVCMLFAAGSLPNSSRKGSNRLLGLPSGMAALWLMGLLSGSPGGARLVQELSLDHNAGKSAAKRFALYTGTMSPMFFVGTLGSWLHNTSLGWLMLLCHLLGAFITGQLSRLIFSTPILPLHENSVSKKPFALAHVIQSAAMAMLTVCGLMVLGSVAAKMVQCTMPNLPECMLAGLQALMEVTAGCSRIMRLSFLSADPALRPALLCAAASFSGLSILLQNLAFLQESGVSLLFLLSGAFCKSIMSFSLCYLLFPLSGTPAAAASTVAPTFSYHMPAALIIVWFLCLLLPDLLNRKKLFS